MVGHLLNEIPIRIQRRHNDSAGGIEGVIHSAIKVINFEVINFADEQTRLLQINVVTHQVAVG